MKKKPIDIGLSHIQKLGIRSARNIKQVINELVEKHGPEKASAIIEALNEASDDDAPVGQLYNVKNKDYDTSMIFSGGYDADIIRRVCNWVNDHQDLFGDSILEIGCDCGFMTTFLGSLFPEKHILAIDRCQAGLDIAKKNADKFGLTNVEFLCTDANDLSGIMFDTVFSLRTMQENGDISEVDKSGLELIPKANAFTEIKKPYASALSKLINEHGNLISIERLCRDALFLGWIQALDDTGLSICLDQYDEISCSEMERVSNFTVLVYSNEEPPQPDSFKSFINCCSKKMNLNLSSYDGWDSQIMYAYTAGKMIEGYEIIDTRFGLKTVATLNHHKFDLNKIVFYEIISGQHHIDIVPASEMNEVIEGFHASLDEAKSLDYIEIIKL